MRRVLVGLVFSVLWTIPVPVLAQQGTSEIGGRVTDDTNAALPGVAIVVTNEQTGVFREILSGPDGGYFMPQMIPGRYQITAKLAGFRSVERKGIVLQVGKTVTLNLTLAVGSVEETVT